MQYLIKVFQALILALDSSVWISQCPTFYFWLLSAEASLQLPICFLYFLLFFLAK
jgi:hypothetical protein